MTRADITELDCGDMSCHFAKEKAGMRTNGGCRCFSNAGFSRSMIASAIEMLPKYLALIQQHKKMREALEGCAQADSVIALQTNEEFKGTLIEVSAHAREALKELGDE